MSDGILVLNGSVGLGRFRVGQHAVGDVQTDGLVRLGRQPVMSRLVRGQIIVSWSEVRQQKVLIGHPGQGLGLDDFPMLAIVDQLDFNRLRLGLVDDRDCHWTGRCSGCLSGNGCD